MGHGDGSGKARGEGQGHGHGQGDTGMIFGTCCIITLVVIFALSFLGLCIAKVIMGKSYFNDCPIQYLIPVYLIVSGSVPLLMGGLLKQDGECNLFNLIGAIGLLFNFAWLICGSVWVFGNYSDVMDGCGGPKEDCCDTSLIKFAFAVTIVDWAFLGLIIAVLCFFFGALMCCTKDEGGTETA